MDVPADPQALLRPLDPGDSSIPSFPGRIICLTEETTEILYLLGEGDRIVGVSGYTVRPPEARLKPRVSAFLTARHDKILALKPDLVLAFSDLQAEIVAELIRRGVCVFTFNQRRVSEILRTILTVARIVGAEAKGLELVARLEAGLRAIKQSAARFPRRPRVFFEEWHDPLISGIAWVEDLIEIAGGETIFPELRDRQAGKDRIVDPAEVAARNPEVIIASWCGRRVKKAVIRSRPGWGEVAAVRSGEIHEIHSSVILQPGPAALTEGVRQIHALLARAVGLGVEPGLAPESARSSPLEDTCYASLFPRSLMSF